MDYFPTQAVPSSIIYYFVFACSLLFYGVDYFGTNPKHLNPMYVHDLQLERVQRRIADRKMKIQVTDAAVELLGSLGYDPNYGARPVKRVIQQNVENELAKGILRGEFKEEDTILIDTEVTAFSNGQLPQQKLVFRRLETDSENTVADGKEAFSPTV